MQKSYDFCSLLSLKEFPISPYTLRLRAARWRVINLDGPVSTLLEKLMLSALKVKCLQPDFAIFFTRIFANSENATKFKETSEYRQETLNILSALKFA